MTSNNFDITGLTDNEVLQSREKHGTNGIEAKKENYFLSAILDIAKEPMVLLLLVASGIYFTMGETSDGIFLAVAILLVSGISLYQNSRSRTALEKLKQFTKPNCKVIRNGQIIEIPTEALVIGDSLLVEEGSLVAGDGTIVHSNDFSVNESILTGESLAVSKDKNEGNNLIFKGTLVSGGLAIATVTAIAGKTELGKIGKSLDAIAEEKTPLELQVNNFVKKMTLVGIVCFVIVLGINYFNSQQFINSLLKALTLAMSILPEEIPVAFATFMALGAWRMMKEGIIVKQMKTVETLGSATVICIDKTGTITENQMRLAKVYALKTNQVTDASQALNPDEKAVVTTAMWASEPIPFDAMEIALHEAYSQIDTADQRPDYKMVHEYPLSGQPPMMTHIFEDQSGNRIVAAKGAAEALMAISGLSAKEKEQINQAITELSKDGYRVLAVGQTDFKGENYPATQQEFAFAFLGLVAFYDPPKKNIKAVLQHFYEAGIAVNIITGDNAQTTAAIANQIGFEGADKSITGEELMQLSDAQLKEQVMQYHLFTRMFPEAKLRIINALKANNQIVAMTGDGVNDGPALKAAHIGIAMGEKGTEIAKQAASLILVNDDLGKMADAIAMGRKIYANLKKAIQFVISIHIPIVLTVFVPLALGWRYPNIFSPIHIIFLELVMGPTCSIVYENEPNEKNAMQQKPRPFSTTFFSWKELSTSILQGLLIAAGTLLVYQFALHSYGDEAIVRTMTFSCLVSANIFLTLVNRSFYYSVFTTIRYHNPLMVIIIGSTALITVLLLSVPLLRSFFGFSQLSLFQLGCAVAIGFVSVIWYEGVKLYKRKTTKKPA